MKDRSSSPPENGSTYIKDSLPIQILTQMIDMYGEEAHIKLHPSSTQQIEDYIDCSEGSDARIVAHRISTSFVSGEYSVNRSDLALVVLQSPASFNFDYVGKLENFKSIETASLVKIERELEYKLSKGNSDDDKTITFGVRHFIDLGGEAQCNNPYILDFGIESKGYNFSVRIHYQSDQRSFLIEILDNGEKLDFSSIGGVRQTEQTYPGITKAINYLGEGYLNDITFSLLVRKFINSIGNPLSKNPINDLI